MIYIIIILDLQEFDEWLKDVQEVDLRTIPDSDIREFEEWLREHPW